MKKIKKIALVALGLMEAAIPVVAMVMGCFISGANTFWCCFLIASAIVFFICYSALFHSTMGGTQNDWKDFLMKVGLLGSIGAFLALCLEFLYLGYCSKHSMSGPTDAQPMGIAFCYLFSVMSVMLLVVDDWKKQDGKAKFFLTCAEIICTSFAIMAGMCLLDNWFGWSIGETVCNVFGYLVGLTIIVLISGIASILANQTFNYHNTPAERWASACGSLVCAGFVFFMLSGVLNNWGVNIPEALHTAFLWIIGGGILGLLFTAVIAIFVKK